MKKSTLIKLLVSSAWGLWVSFSSAQSYKALSPSDAQVVEFDSENCQGYWTPDYKCQTFKVKG